MNQNKHNINRALIIDNDPEIGNSLQMILVEEGCEAVVFADPEEAVEAISLHEFDLAFVDINHPHIDGPLLAGTLKSHNRNLTVVMTTKGGSFDEAVRSIRIGAYDYLCKPFNKSDVALILERYKLKNEFKQRAVEAERRHTLLLQHMPALIFIINKEMRLKFVNKALLPMLGYTIDESSSDKGWILDLVHQDDRVKVSRFFNHAFKTKLPFTAECRFIHKQGQVLHTIIRSIPDPSPTPDKGQKDALECVVMDITDRVLLEQSMLQDEKLKTLGAVTAELAHEIRNPLMAIGGFARRLIKKAPQMAEAEIILNESKRLESLLNRINSYLSPMQIKRESARVNSLIASSIEMLSRQISEAELNVSRNLSDSLPLACADADQLKQIFVNVTLAAVNSCIPNSRLIISSFHRDKDIVVIYTFFDADRFSLDPDRIFMPFEEGGESLGLYLSYRVLKHMGGTMVYNRVNDNLEFSITLPRFDMAGGQDTYKTRWTSATDTTHGGIHPPEKFSPMLRAKWGESLAEHQSIALLLVGMDGFAPKPFGSKPRNTQAASLVGAAITSAAKGINGFMAQYSDFMYAVVIAGYGKGELTSLAHKIMEVCSTSKGDTDKARPGALSVSIGIAIKTPEMDSTYRELISEASDNLRKALDNGPGGIFISG